MATQPKKARKVNAGEPVERQEDENTAPISMDTTNRPDKAKSDSSSSFLRAARAGNVDKVLELLKSGKADVNTCNSNGLNALHLAAKEGHIDIVSELLGRGAQVDAATKKGNSGLHIASLAGQLDVVKILVQNGARINNQSQNGFTPLYMACQENHAPVVRYLLDKGANPTLATGDGFTPMAVALQQGHNEVVSALTDYSQKGRVRLSALHVAAKKDDVRAAALLLQNDQNAESTSKNGGIVNETTKSDFTPLHIAAHYGNVNVAALLIEKGANVNFKAKNGITPLHVSSKWGRKNVVQLLIESYANIECLTRDGLTPLHCAARSGHDLVVDLLLERGAPVASKTRNGLTSLHMAAQGDHVDSARVLIFHRAPIDEVTVDYLTPLHVAAHCGNVAVAKLLLEKNCQVDARALNGFTPLHIACKKNRIKVIELLLQYGAMLNSTTESGLTPLHVASFMGHIEIVTYLLHQGCDPNAKTVRGETSLHLATRGNQTAIMKVLLRNGAHVDAKAKEDQTALHVASRQGSVDCVLVLLEHGASPNANTVELYTPLHIAAKEGHEEVVQILLDRGAEQQRTTSKGFTALHIAAKYGCLRVANVLLKKNANPNVDGKNGLTPLHVAAHYNHPSMVKLLLDQRASPHTVAKNGYTALHIAAKKDEIEVATILLDHGAKANAESKNGFTPLHLAAQEGHTDMVTLLLEHKAQVNGRAKNGLTAMHLAAQEDHVPVAEILEKFNGAIDPQTKAGYTPLHTACHFGQLNMIRFLLRHNASVSSVTKLGYTPLHQAAQQGHVLVINLLLQHKADPNVLTSNGQTPLSISQQLGYISVVEILRQVTQVQATTSTTVQYRMLSPEMMQEAAMSDEDDDGETNLADQSYQYLTTDDMRGFEDNSAVQTKDQDLFAFERQSGRRSVASSIGGRDKIQDELRYTTEADEMAIESTASTGLQDYSSLRAGVQRQPSSPPVEGPSSPDYHTDDMDVDNAFRAKAWDDHIRQFETAVAPEKLADREEEMRHAGDNQKMRLNSRPPSLDFYSPCVNGVDIVITGEEPHEQQREVAYLAAATPLTETLPTPTDNHNYRCNMSETDSRMFGGSSSAMSYASSFDPDNVALRRPIYSGFLVSFLVDARGGAMRGCRHSGIRIIIPPLKVCQPTRITCKLVRRDKIAHPPPLMEGEALASRVLLMGPAGAKFTGPVVLEVPHFAALHGNEREIMVLRSENGQTWREHTDIATEQTIHNALCGSFEGEDLESAEDLYHRRITRIITTDFPKYFAIVSRIHQDSVILGPDGGVMSSETAPQVQVIFPPGALTKSIRVGLQAQSVPSELIVKTLGSGVFVGPITTIEPRRRKFHRAIQVTLPLPRELQREEQAPKINVSHLRLLCSITGGTDDTEWEDITGSTPMNLENNCVSFTTSVSARFWLVYCPHPSGVVNIATQLYDEAIVVPFMANFVIFAKRRSNTEAQLRMFCMTDDKMDKTLESQEGFIEIARSRDVEVLNGKPQYIEMEGNLVIMQKPADPLKPDNREDKENERQLYINFRAFKENRRHVNVRTWDPTGKSKGTAIFLAEPPIARNQIPICTLSVDLNDAVEGRYADANSIVSADTIEICQKLEALRKIEFPEDEQISKAQLRLTDIAEYLEADWIILAKQLGITGDEIKKIQLEYGYVVEQALVMLHLWVEKNRENATGNILEKALKCIRREDIIHRCIRTVEEVTDVSEKKAAKAQLISLDKPSDAVLNASVTREPVDDGKDDCIVPQLDSRRGVLGDQPAVSSVAYNAAIDQLADQLCFSQSSVDDKTVKVRQDESGAGQDDDSNLATPPSTPTLPTDISLHRQVTEEELVASIKRKSTADTEMSLDSLEPRVSSEPKPTLQTFEDWATQTSPMPGREENSVTQQAATAARQTYLETAFEDWVEQREMSHKESAPEVQLPNRIESENGDVDGAEITTEVVEGEIEVRVEMDDGEEVREDGSRVYRQTVTRRHICPVSEYITVNGVATKSITNDRLLSVQIEEDLLVMPPGVASPDDSDNLMTVTDCHETEDQLPDGTPVYRKVTTTLVLPKQSAELEAIPAIELRAEQIVEQSVKAALVEVQAISSPGEPIPYDDLLDDLDGDDSELATLRVYTDTLEGEPEVETDVQEFEETLPDGTVIRKRITKTKQKQTFIKRVVMEGPEDELPTTLEQTQQLLLQSDLNNSIDRDMLQRYGDRRVDEVVDEPETSIQEFEETLDDGTVVRRKIVTTTQQQLKTERVVLEGDSDEDFDDSERIFVVQGSDDDVGLHADSTEDGEGSAAEANGTVYDNIDDDGDNTRIILKKEIRTQRVIRDGKEETIITEDVHVVQEDEPPPELEGAMQNVIEQFMGRSHSGQSSV